MQLAFYFDQSRCSGCNCCVVACKDFNQIAPGTAHWRRHTAEEHGIFPELKIFNLVMSCNHCAEPACMSACPAGAIYKMPENGIVVVKREECQEFKTCVAACPFGGPQFGDDQQEPSPNKEWVTKHPMQKCNFCITRWQDGKKPICVEACPQRALDAGPMDQLMNKYPGAQKTVAGFPKSHISRVGFPLSKDTVPSVLFKPKA